MPSDSQAFCRDKLGTNKNLSIMRYCFAQTGQVHEDLFLDRTGTKATIT